MNKLLNDATDSFYLKIKDERANYKSCYDSFNKYCNGISFDTLNVLFSKITLEEIKQACVLYYESSKRTRSIEAINRFLSAIDLLYVESLKKSGIVCRSLERGCRNKDKNHV